MIWVQSSGSRVKSNTALSRRLLTISIFRVQLLGRSRPVIIRLCRNGHLFGVISPRMRAYWASQKALSSPIRRILTLRVGVLGRCFR